jgi:Icc-related predicted phosphoesterase
MAKLHAKARSTLERLLSKPRDERPVVVVTHHAPHPLCVPAESRGRWDAGRYASDLSHLTDSGRVDLWIHGHVHESVDLMRPGGTRIICNPAGSRVRNASFQPNLVVEVPAPRFSKAPSPPQALPPSSTP